MADDSRQRELINSTIWQQSDSNSPKQKLTPIKMVRKKRPQKSVFRILENKLKRSKRYLSFTNDDDTSSDDNDDGKHHHCKKKMDKKYNHIN